MAIFFLAVLFLLTRQLSLLVDTERNLYCLNVKYVVTVSFLPADDDFFIEIKTFFYKKRIKIIESIANKEKQAKKEKKKKKSADKKSKKKQAKPFDFYYEMALLGISLIKDLLMSFEIRKYKVIIDTGDFTINAKLYALVPFLERINIKLEPNFLGKNAFTIIIVNYVYKPILIIAKVAVKALWLFLKYK